MCVMHGWDGLQTRVLADDAGTVLVMGGPGTGRTSVCLEIAARHVAFGGRLSEVLVLAQTRPCLLYTSPSPRDVEESRMPSSA